MFSLMAKVFAVCRRVSCLWLRDNLAGKLPKCLKGSSSTTEMVVRTSNSVEIFADMVAELVSTE